MGKVIVCGAGIGGMVSAIYLSHKNFDVEIFEKNHKAGGKLSEFYKDGFRFDTGPCLITVPYIFRKFFTDISRNIDDYVDFIELEESCKYFWEDGTVLNSYCNHTRLSCEIKDVFGNSEERNFFRYLEYGKIFYDLSKDYFIEDDFKIRNYISKDKIKNFTKFVSGMSVNDVSNKFFKNKKLKQLMDRYSAYNGSSPFLTPQFFTIIPYVEHIFGTWFVKGGIYKIVEALQKLCEEYNIKINYGYELMNIENSNRVISKLFFKTSGETLETSDFDLIVSNFTNNKSLMDADYFDNTEWSSSGFILHLGLTKEFLELSHYNILFSDDYEKEFIDIFEKKIPSDDMTIYISITKKIECNDAPNDCENWFVFVNVPFISNNFTWNEKNKLKYKEMVIDRIEAFSYLFDDSIRNHIKFCEIFTPDDFLKNYNSEFGSIHGLSSNSLYTLMKRPKNKSRKFDNLYITGGNTHPGGGLPLCFISGRIVSQMVDKEYSKSPV